MATATHEAPVARPDEADPSSTSAISPRSGEYHCACGHALRVFGVGRHRIYFEAGSARLDAPVMNRACSQCGRGLPGMNRPVAMAIRTPDPQLDAS